MITGRVKHPWVLNAFFVLIISLVCSAISSGITAVLVSNHIGHQVTTQGENGLELFYTQALAQCRDTRKNTIKLRDGFQQLNIFSNVLDQQFGNGLKAARLTIHDPKQSKAAVAAAKERIAAYNKFVEILPRPDVPPVPPLCKDVVKSPAELAQQVRNRPGTKNVTTNPNGP